MLKYESVADQIAEAQLPRWTKIPIQEGWHPATKRQALRLNALGSLFEFEYTVLGYTRLTRHFHEEHITKQLECTKLRKVLEIPRDHFKTTCATIGAPMWWALPFTEEDEKQMRALGYGDAWIVWMKRAHNTCTRTLIASEITKNARKMGDKIAQHYEVNRIFKYLFPEIIPTGKERWSQDSRIHRRTNDGIYQSEGTYDFIGSEAALQSNHYDRIIEDDLVGEDAVSSDSVMQGLIDWHQKLPGCFDSIPGHPDDLGDQLVIANRWSHRDLNTHIRKNELSYTILMHSAEGGCCDAHPAGQPIFPEEFSMLKLSKIREIEGDYSYSCHFLNNPVAKGATRFKTEWLSSYSYAAWELDALTPQNTVNYHQLSRDMRRLSLDQLDSQAGAAPRKLRMAMHHEVSSGVALEDVRAADLDRIMLMDPNHAGEYGRSRNAILVLGIYKVQGKAQRIYLLDAWAKACSHEEWIDAAIGERTHAMGMAWRWKIHRLFGEFEAAGQQGWHHFFKERLKIRSIDNRFALHSLKTDRSENAKTQRIISMEPIYQTGAWWMPSRGDARNLFMDEFNHFPHGANIDLLDLAGYSPQTFLQSGSAEQRQWITAEQSRRREQFSHIGKAGY